MSTDDFALGSGSSVDDSIDSTERVKRVKGQKFPCHRIELDNPWGISVGHKIKGIHLVTHDDICIANADFKNILQRKKLYLVIVLEGTMLNVVYPNGVSQDEKYLMSQIQTHSPQEVSNGSLFKVDMSKWQMLAKLRPFVHTFLKEASDLFEIYIYTTGKRSCVSELVNLLDPGKTYIDDRVISLPDCIQMRDKGLVDVGPDMDRTVCILSAGEGAWHKYRDNLILVHRYLYFSATCHSYGFDRKSLCELKEDENEVDGALATTLKHLKQVHSMFFDQEMEDDIAVRDVREVLKSIRKEILKDCRILFNSLDASDYYWEVAERLGATCCSEADPFVTHVVMNNAGNDKSPSADLQEKKLFVSPGWIKAALYSGKKQPEDKFPVSPNKY